MGTKPAVFLPMLVIALHAWRNNPSSDPGEQSVTLASRWRRGGLKHPAHIDFS
ncbi:hypothetical protein ABH944_001060 [Caballeronia udeis]|jgi:hypothetical protein|uniref:Uncharacterized protein n=1 Tax=Caballeronia udeis TaxID=1232866 RepID=A0ABW8MCU7_9BURK